MMALVVPAMPSFNAACSRIRSQAEGVTGAHGTAWWRRPQDEWLVGA
jgi:hypothetical protein